VTRRWEATAAFVSGWGWSCSLDRRLFLHDSICVPLLFLSAACALATISASASQILVVMAPPSVFTLEQRIAHCVRQNASMETCNNGIAP